MKTSEWLKRHGVVLKKSLGQVFLSDQRIAKKIASFVPSGSKVFEIGAGAGTLTEELAKRAESVVAVEIDRRLEPLLRERLGPFENVKLIFGDFLELDLTEYGEHVFVGNLPYHLAARMIGRILKETATELAVLMVQKEVAERITARPRSKAYGSLSVFVQDLCNVETLFHVAPSHFVPNPKVASSVIALHPLGRTSDPEFESFVKACFSRRRKKLVNSAKIPPQLLEMAGIPPDVRPEELDVEGYRRLFEVVKAWRKTSTR